MADAPIQSPFSGLQTLIPTVLGSSTTGSDNRQLTTQQLLDSILNNTQDTTQTTNGTQSTDALTQLLSHLTGNTTNTQQTNANVDPLKQVFAQQQAGITPDMLKAIFTEGAKQVPQLTAATANAVGARSSDNSPLATALRDLNSSLTSQAATMNQSMLKDSASTAGQIADLTKTTTGSTTQDQTQGQNTTQNQNVTSTQALQTLMKQLQTNNQSTNTNQQQRNDTKSLTGINLPQTAGAAGLAGLLSLLNGGGGSSLLGSLKGLLGGGSSGGGDILSGGGSFGSVGDLNLNPFDGSPGFDTSGTGGYSNGYDGSSGGPINYFNDPNTPQFKDGGIVGDPKLLSIDGGSGAGKKNAAGGIQTLLALATMLGAGSVASKKADAGTSSTSSSTGTTSTGVPGAPDNSPWQAVDLGNGPAQSYQTENGANPNPSSNFANLSPEFLQSIGWKGADPYSNAYDGQQTDSGPTDQGAKTGYSTDFTDFLDKNGLTLKTASDMRNQYVQAVGKDGQQVGTTFSRPVDSDSDFGMVMGLLTAAAGGLAATGLAAGAGATGAGLSAAGGAGAGFAGTLSQSADVGAAAKGAVVGGITGGIAGGVNLPGQFGITNPVAGGAINGAVRGGVGSALNGGDPLNGAIMGGVKGTIPGIKKEIGMADGGVIQRTAGDPSGTADNLSIQVSGGEAILPKDVVDHLGPDFIHSLIALFHTPTAQHGTV